MSKNATRLRNPSTGEYVILNNAGELVNQDDQAIGGATVQTVYAASVTLTNAQIKALPTTPFELVAAQGANQQIVPLVVYGTIHTEAGAYTNLADGATITNGGNGVLAVFGDDDSDASVMGYTALFASTALRRFALIGAIKSVTGDDAISDGSASGDQSNKALNLIIRNAAGNLTGGNVANSLNVTTLYTVIDVS